jgi:hypothetical protein
MEIAQGAIRPCRRHGVRATSGTAFDAPRPVGQGECSIAQLSAYREAHKRLGGGERGRWGRGQFQKALQRPPDGPWRGFEVLWLGVRAADAAGRSDRPLGASGEMGRIGRDRCRNPNSQDHGVRLRRTSVATRLSALGSKPQGAPAALSVTLDSLRRHCGRPRRERHER